VNPCHCHFYIVYQVADILNDLSMFIELLSPLFPTHFVLLVCIASFCRAIVGVAGGATRAALIQHQALYDVTRYMGKLTFFPYESV
jgi:L-cystine uptake protein TcyP (sodium:dicarboxylate symporter family)